MKLDLAIGKQSADSSSLFGIGLPSKSQCVRLGGRIVMSVGLLYLKIIKSNQPEGTRIL